MSLTFVVVIFIVWASPAQSDLHLPPLTYVSDAIKKGAVCLNGSIPTYQMDRGYGDGSSNWILHLEGGGWCFNETHCNDRATWKFNNKKPYDGILSPNHVINPYFYNWNKIYTRYCDGGGYLADIPERSPVHGLYFRGARIFKAVVEDLLRKGMSTATNAILSGDSAGGLAAMYHCDKFQQMLPSNVRVKCVPSAGFFIHGDNGLLTGLEKRESQVFQIVGYHRLVDKLPQLCTSRMTDPRLCFFPEYFVGDIKTPLFIVNSAFDEFQIRVRVDHSILNWEPGCYYNKSACRPDEVKIIEEFGSTFREALPKADGTCMGMFIHSLTTHVDTINSHWNNRQSFALDNKTMAEAVAGWFYDRTPFRVVSDKKFPIFFNTSNS